MKIEVELPDLGPEAEDRGTVVEWHFEEGDKVEAGEPLLQIASESGTLEVPCPRPGTLLERVVDEDDTVRAGEPLAVIECSEEDDSDGELDLPAGGNEDSS